MIVGIGCDLTEIYRVKKALTIEMFAARVFSPAEQEYCEAPWHAEICKLRSKICG